MTTLSHLECGLCGGRAPADVLQTLSTCCRRPLLARYDLERAARTLTRAALRSRRADLWRYEEVLPVADPSHRVTLGEGWTPLVAAPRLARTLRVREVTIKDESLNPTGSFKARGMAVAVSRAKELGATSLAVPSAGNAAGALAAYAAAAGLPAFVFMPSDVPRPFRVECEQLGAEVTLVDGLITDCGARVREGAADHGWFDCSTLKEPYRLEGKKTLGYELAEQFDFDLPEVIIYPTGGGTGLIGMWKAFDEMEAMGWIGARRPRLVVVQSDGCAPIVRAFDAGAEFAEPFPNAATKADGLRVPAAVGDFLILKAVRQTQGTAVAVSDAAMLDEARVMGREAGVFPCPEGAATLAAARLLHERGFIGADDRVVLFNTGTPLKYVHLW